MPHLWGAVTTWRSEDLRSEGSATPLITDLLRRFLRELGCLGGVRNIFAAFPRRPARPTHGHSCEEATQTPSPQSFWPAAHMCDTTQPASSEAHSLPDPQRSPQRVQLLFVPRLTHWPLHMTSAVPHAGGGAHIPALQTPLPSHVFSQHACPIAPHAGRHPAFGHTVHCVR